MLFQSLFFRAGCTDIRVLIYLMMSITGMTTRNAENDGERKWNELQFLHRHITEENLYLVYLKA